MEEEVKKLNSYMFEFNHDVSKDFKNEQLQKLSKYDDYKINENYTDWFGKIPHNMFEDRELNSYDIALYTYLVSRAHIKTRQGDVILNNVAAETIVAEFDIDSRNKKKIKQSFQQLEVKGYINLSNSFRFKSVQFINVRIRDNSGNFFKVYKNAVDRIICLSHNIHVIARLSAYASIRSFIYEGKSNSRVAYALTDHIVTNSRLKRTNCLDELDWLVNNRILACFNCVRKSRQGGRKKYYSDIGDHTQLKWFIASQFRDNKLRNVVN